MSQPSVSLVIPTLNVAPWIERTLASVLDQDHPALDCLLIDGGSTDRTLELAGRFAGHRLRVFVRPGLSHAAAVNLGLAETRGEICAWLGGDDLYFPWTLKAACSIFATFPEVAWLSSLRPAIADPHDIVTGSVIPGFSRQAFLDGRYLPREGRTVSVRGPVTSLRPIQQESTFFRRSLWEAAGGLDAAQDPAADFGLWARFYQRAELYGTPVPLGAFRVRPGQRSAAVADYQYAAGAILESFRAAAGWTPAPGEPVYRGKKVVRREVLAEELRWAIVEHEFADDFTI